MDSKVNSSTRKILEQLYLKPEHSLKEKIRNVDYRLPRPRFHKIRPIGPKSYDTADLAYWKRIPAEVKKDEFKRMHSFFFGTTSESEPTCDNIKPFPLYPPINQSM